MEYRIDKLRPGSRYALQIRSLNDEEASEWSPAFYVTLPTDTTIPANTGGAIGTYTNKSFKFTWNGVSTNSDASPAYDIKGYALTIGDGVNEYDTFTNDTEYVVTASEFLSRLGNGDTVSISVVAVDISGNQSSTPGTGSASAPTPSNVTNFGASPGVSTVKLSWTNVPNVTIAEYEIYADTTTGFTPDTSTFTNLIARTSGDSYVWTSGSSASETKFFQIRAKSIFGEYSGFVENSSTTVSGGGGGGGDLEILNEGSSLTTTATSLNFVGSAVNATTSTDDVTATIDNIIEYDFSYTGELPASVPYTGTHRRYISKNSTILEVRASVGVAPASTAVKVDINKNGTTIFTTQGNRPTIAAAGYTSGAVTNMDVTSLTAGDYLTVDIDETGTGTRGSDLTVYIRIKES